MRDKEREEKINDGWSDTRERRGGKSGGGTGTRRRRLMWISNKS